jgi:hypothetical protein
MSEHLTDEQLREWADKRADDAGRLARDFVALRARVMKTISELEFATSQLQAPHDAETTPIEDRVQWAYRRGARDAYLEVIKALQEALAQ